MRIVVSVLQEKLKNNKNQNHWHTDNIYKLKITN